MGDLTFNEKKIAERFIFLDNAIDVLEAELRGLGEGSLKIKESYINKVTKGLYVGQLERRELKQEMQRLKIKVEYDQTTDNEFTFVFLAGKRSGGESYYRKRLVYEIRKVMNELLDSPEKED